jgi:hypothetical protein
MIDSFPLEIDTQIKHRSYKNVLEYLLSSKTETLIIRTNKGNNSITKADICITGSLTHILVLKLLFHFTLKSYNVSLPVRNKHVIGIYR